MFELGFHCSNRAARIGSLPQDHDTACNLAFTVQLCDAAPQFRTDLDIRNIAECHRHAARFGAQRYAAKIRQRSEITRCADHILRFAHLDDRAAGFLIARLNCPDNLRMRHTQRGHTIWVENDLVLLDHAANARDFGDPGYGLQLVAQEPVLQAAQPGKVVSAATVHQCIFVNPPDPCCIGAERALNSFGKAILDLIEIFENPRARPVKIGSVFEDDIDIAVAEEGIAAHCFGAGNRKHGCGHRVGHLILNNSGSLSRIVRADHHLYVGEVGQRIDRCCSHRPETGQRQPDRRQHHEEAIGNRAIDNASNHCPVFRIDTMRGPVPTCANVKETRSPRAKPRNCSGPSVAKGMVIAGHSSAGTGPWRRVTLLEVIRSIVPVAR